MAIYSVNQVRHLYVAKSLSSTKVTESSTAGAIRPVADTAKSHLYFEYKGATDLMRSDIIPIDNIICAKATKASDMKKKATQTTITLNSSINEGKPIAGADYILNIIIRQYIGISDRNQAIKYGAVRTYKGMSASEFYLKMAKSLALNFSREASQLLKFYVTTSTASTEITPTTNISSLTGTYTGIKITEAEQEWVLGVKPLEPVYYQVTSSPVTIDGDQVLWATITQSSVDGSHNGKEIADLEYFCMGDRGDVYRNAGWPNVINTTYLVDPDTPYDTIDIHYFYQGDNENPQRSEKDITIVVPNSNGNSTLTDSIIGAINTASGLSIKKLVATT